MSNMELLNGAASDASPAKFRIYNTVNFVKTNYLHEAKLVFIANPKSVKYISETINKDQVTF